MTRGRKLKYPITLDFVSEKQGAVKMTIDRGRDTPEDHAFVVTLRGIALFYFSNRADEDAALKREIVDAIEGAHERVKALDAAAHL